MSKQKLSTYREELFRILSEFEELIRDMLNQPAINFADDANTEQADFLDRVPEEQERRSFHAADASSGAADIADAAADNTAYADASTDARNEVEDGQAPEAETD